MVGAGEAIAPALNRVQLEFHWVIGQVQSGLVDERRVAPGLLRFSISSTSSLRRNSSPRSWFLLSVMSRCPHQAYSTWLSFAIFSDCFRAFPKLGTELDRSIWPILKAAGTARTGACRQR